VESAFNQFIAECFKTCVGAFGYSALGACFFVGMCGAIACAAGWCGISALQREERTENAAFERGNQAPAGN
jgi:hypothetical protein